MGEILGEISSPESHFLKYLADLVFRRPSYAVIILVGLLKLGPKQNKPGFCTFGPMSHFWLPQTVMRIGLGLNWTLIMGLRIGSLNMHLNLGLALQIFKLLK